MATVTESETAQLSVETSLRSRPALDPAPLEQGQDPAYQADRKPYLFTAAQALAMADAGIFDGAGHVELWDGVFYKMTKGELHNAILTELAVAVRAVVPRGYQVREEKSCSADPHSLPEPDLMVYQGGPWDHVRANRTPPPLSKMQILIEVNHTTPEDYTKKLAKYARAGVPTYWVVNVAAGSVTVFTKPVAEGSNYGESKTFSRGEEIGIVLEGRTVGNVRVSDFFPPEDFETEKPAPDA